MRFKTVNASLLCVLLMSLLYAPFQIGIGHSQENTASDFSFSIEHTNSSFTIHSVSSKGNFSFTFEWENTGTYIEYNGTSRLIRELRRVVFTDETKGYAMEYWIPRMFYEYVDADNDGLFTGSSNMNWTMPGADIYVIGYKINTNIDLTNITQTQAADGTKLLEWSYTQLAMPMESGVQGPWEQFPTVEEVFHYNPFNGTLKMDIILDNFKSRNDASRVFLSYGIRYIHLQPGNVTLTVAIDDKEFQLSQLNKVYSINSNVIVFKADGIEQAFFDFGGTTFVDGNSNVQVQGSIGPPDLYWLNEGNVWLAIGLNYPHINRTMIHDPYFGLFQIALLPPLSPFWTIVTALVSVAFLIVVIYNYRKTKNLFRIPSKLIAIVERLPKRTG